ncbi:MAG: cyclodeaminase/cyclohydrolase family protein, partial [Anaerolineae bacterium]|nr:cyclodeaminase/cyclohydrolase family protein [Anaerolineae bacterium]
TCKRGSVGYRLLEEADKTTNSDYTPDAFLDALAAPTATPGGGSAAALAGALAAALSQMVAGVTVGKKKYADVQDQAESVLSWATMLRAQLSAAIQNDAAAFESLMAAFSPARCV